MGRWDSWHEIENAQAKADAEGFGPRPEPPPEPPKVDREVEAAVAEVERLTSPHPIPPTMPGATQPTNPDGTPRIGYWVGWAWVDGVRPPRQFDLRMGVRALAKIMSHATREDTDDRP